MTPNAKEKMPYHQDNTPYYKSTVTMAKLYELNFKLLPHPAYPPDLALSDYYLFADLKMMLQRRDLYQMMKS